MQEPFVKIGKNIANLIHVRRIENCGTHLMVHLASEHPLRVEGDDMHSLLAQVDPEQESPCDRND